MTEATELHLAADPFLEAWVRLAEKGVEVSVIISSQGLLITGRLVSFDRFLERLEAEARRSGGGAIGLADALEQLREARKAVQDEELEAESQGNEETTRKQQKYFHLLDASILSGGQIYNAELWRGKVSDVNGLTLGTFQL